MALENNQIESSSIDNDEISLKELILKIKEWGVFLKSKLKIIFLAGFIGASIGLIIAYNSKTTYKATLTFALEEDKGGGNGSGLSGALGIASSLGIDLAGGGGGAFAASNLAELMKSRLLVERVLLNPVEVNGKTITLAEYYIQINNLRASWDKNPVLKNINYLPKSDPNKFSLEQDSILTQIYNDLINPNKLSIMQKDKKVSILYLDVVNENEIFSKTFCENLAKETSAFYIETKSKKAKLNVDILQKQIDSLKISLNSAITGVANETDNVYNLNPAFNIKSTPSKKKQIDVQANTVILSNLFVQLELAKINLRKETPLIQFIDQPIFPLSKNKTSKFKSLIIGFLVASIISILYITIANFIKKVLN